MSSSMEIEDEASSCGVPPRLALCQVFWGKHEYEIELDLQEPIIVFKAQLFALTQVNPDRQKLIYQGRIIKEETWEKYQLRSNDKIRMVGTNDVVVIPAPVEEDKTTPKPVTKLPPMGIKNYGNTCYMNSVVQVLRHIPELKEAIIKFKNENESSDKSVAEGVLIRSLSEAIKALDERDDNYENLMKEFIQQVDSLFPEYSASIEKGGRPQQDANEFFMRLLDIFKRNINYQANAYVKGRNLVETLFGIDFDKQFKCLDKDGDSTKTISETEIQLSCFITVDTKFMLESIKKKLNEIVTKHSVLLNRETNFSVNTTFTRLPAYLCVQFVRFFYKEHEKVNAKILKDVKFPLRLDLTEFCSSSLKNKLRSMQTVVRDFETKIGASETESSLKLIQKKLDSGIISLPEQKLSPGDSGSAIYNLIAVITHEGRTTSSGHYVGWVRLQPKKWIKLDDSTVSYVEEEDILKLSGGGESHSAYLLIYQSFKLPQ